MKQKYFNQEITKPNIDVNRDFDVSVIMPFYKRMDAFKEVLPKNAKYLQRNGIEVIIPLDNHKELADLTLLIKKYNSINWKVIVNHQEHEPRNPAKVINVGIRNSTKKYILISDPEVEFFTDVIYKLRTLLEYYPNHYAIGKMAFVEYDDEINDDNFKTLFWMDYGSIMTEKDFIEKIKGYDEDFKFWGGEDDNIRKRLDILGIKKLLSPDALSLHREKKLKLKNRLNKTMNFSHKELKHMLYPNKMVVNSVEWGTEFNDVFFNWKNRDKK